MISTVATSKKALPQDPEKLRSYSWELCLSYQQLSEKYNKLLRKMYGRSTEKHIDTENLDAIQLEMDGLLEQALAVEEQVHSTEEEETIEITPPSPSSQEIRQEFDTRRIDNRRNS